MNKREGAILAAIKMGMRFFPQDVVKELADNLIDKFERCIERSDTKIDDALAMPIINALRKGFDIPDGDDVAVEDEPPVEGA